MSKTQSNKHNKKNNTQKRRRQVLKGGRKDRKSLRNKQPVLERAE